MPLGHTAGGEGENKQETKILRFSVQRPHESWKTEPGQSRVGGGRAFKSSRKNNSNNGVRPTREGEKVELVESVPPAECKEVGERF